MDNSKPQLKITKTQIKEVYKTLKTLSDSYIEKDTSISDNDWLSKQYKVFFPNLTDKEASELSNATINGVRRFDASLNDAINAASSGKNKEQWFAEKMSQEITDMDVNEAGTYIHALDSALLRGNKLLMEATPIQIEGNNISVTMPEEAEILQITDNQWNKFTLKEALSHIGQSAALAGLQTLNHLESYGFSADAVKNISDYNPNLKSLIENEDKENLKTLLTAAIKIGINNEHLPFLSKAAPVDMIASIASNGVEYVSTLSKFSSGKITLMQAMDHIGLSGVSLLYNICSVEGIRNISTALLSQIPIVGPVIGNIIGGVISMTLGEKFHEKVQNTIRKVEKTVRTAVNNAWNTVKAVGQKIKNKVKNFCNWLFT